MKEAINQITRALTGNESIEECSEKELQQMTRLYPFFGPAHFLLAKKAAAGSDDAVSLIQKASLYFSNPLWFDRLMKETGISAQPSADPVIDGVPHDTVLETPTTKEELVVQSANIGTDEWVPFNHHTELETPATREELVVQSEDIPIVESEPEPDINEVPETAAVGQQQEEHPEPEESAGTIETADVPEDRLASPVRFPSLKIEPLDPGKMELSFEPYHTVDYFASQGIRFREEEKPKDRLGHQLKSFTEWLKTLKKLPASEIPVTTNQQDEKKIEQMAQHSITDREVVTEAMAEVWEKQGNAVKAVELYKKLSLLDPSKSSYFAAKIEHLKQL